MKLYYSITEVSKEANCTYQWVLFLCKAFEIKPKKIGEAKKKYYLTESQKDDLVRLRWLYKDSIKCVEYCWKNKIII